MTTKLIRNARYPSRSLHSASRSCWLVVLSVTGLRCVPTGTGRASASSVIAIATTASEKKTTRSAALASTSGSSPAGLAAGGPGGRCSCDGSDGLITVSYSRFTADRRPLGRNSPAKACQLGCLNVGLIPRTAAHAGRADVYPLGYPGRDRQGGS